MKTALDILRVVCISVETVVFLASLAVLSWWPSVFIYIGSELRGENEFAKWLFLFPVTMVAASGAFAWKILFPFESVERMLSEWEDFPRIRRRVGFACTLVVLCAVASVASWFLKSTFPSVWIGFVPVVSALISAVSTASLALATAAIRIILLKYDPQTKGA